MQGAGPVHGSLSLRSTWLGEAWGFPWPSVVNLEAGVCSHTPVPPRETLTTNHVSEPPDGGVSLPGDPLKHPVIS